LAISIMLTLWILGLLWDSFFSAFVPGVQTAFRAFLPEDVVAQLESWRIHQALGLTLLVSFIVVVGFVARRYVGKSLLALMDKVVAAIPGLNFIYGTIRQFTSTMDPDSPQRDAFRQAVLVKVAGGYMMGFLTSRSNIGNKSYATVFIVCNQLIQGYNLLVPHRDVMPLEMNMDDAIKYVVSFGMVAPPSFLPRERRRVR
jgi:uncharacterized membrane protein